MDEETISGANETIVGTFNIYELALQSTTVAPELLSENECQKLYSRKTKGAQTVHTKLQEIVNQFDAIYIADGTSSLPIPPSTPNTTKLINHLKRTNLLKCWEGTTNVLSIQRDFTVVDQVANVKSWYDERYAEIENYRTEGITNFEKIIAKQSRPISSTERTAIRNAVHKRSQDLHIALQRNVIAALNDVIATESPPRKNGLSGRRTHFLTKWFNEHLQNPYPSPQEKEIMAVKCNLTKKQIDYW